MNRLDEIEREHSAVLAAYTAKGCGPEIDPEGEQYTARDILALVAVARAAKMIPCASDMRRDLEGSDWNAASINALCGALEELDAALAPLLAEKEG